MTLSISFDDQPVLMGDEVRDEAEDRLLPTELHAVELGGTEMLPKQRFTIRLIAAELPGEMGTLVQRAMRPNDFVIAPLPNHLFTRDTSAWIYGGVSINHMYWPARQHESLNVETVYSFHPRFEGAGFPIWFGGADHDWGGASIEGGDIMPIGDGVVLVGQGERTNARAVSILAKNLFAGGGARLVIGAVLVPGAAAPKLVTREMLAIAVEGGATRGLPFSSRGVNETCRVCSLTALTESSALLPQ